ncbi:hypothetical protein [Salinimicrobium oceani]|uniref:HEAT repeat domain-containing protein n=1 Tax=Salinimicrobium oceani TaxID=2722702 RepID=A0ABX1D1N1_9FLAO|nr:hypothetical protein [Salinimicrobium oceani]NJW53049.1 hypothetical protein [Salinimicrobium oceani]
MLLSSKVGRASAMGDVLSPFMEQLVLFVIFAVFGTALLFFLLTLYKKLRRLKRNKKKTLYQISVENVLFKYLFEDLSVQQALENPDYLQMQADPLFKRVAIKTIISLHKNYSGTYSRKLELFFEESRLVNYSIGKLESSRWPYIVEGIRDLSTLNHKPSYSRIASRIIHPHDLVKTEVLIALIKMRGIEEIMKFQNTGLQLNDWIQSSILYTIKKHKIPPPANFGLMLKSRNETLILLAVRLISYYGTTEFETELMEISRQCKSLKLKTEISGLLSKTETIIQDDGQ